MLDGLPGILNLAAAGGTELALTSDIVTDGLTSMGLSAKDTNKFVDIMAAACSSSNTSVELMGETLKYAGSTAGALGIDMDDLSVAIGLMANSGMFIMLGCVEIHFIKHRVKIGRLSRKIC